MEELDLRRTRITGDFGTNEIARRTPVDGIRITADYSGHKETYVRLRHYGEKLDVFIVPLNGQNLRENASSNGKAPRGGFVLEFDYDNNNNGGGGGFKDRKLLTY